MRIRVIAAAVVALSAAPAYAQSNDVTGPRTLNATLVTCTDLPITSKPIPRLVIAGPHLTDGRSAMSSGLIVINRTPEDGLEIGQRYVAQRMITDPKRFPRPGEGYGDLRVTGWITVRAIDENNALASIDFACDSVETGDFLEPWVETALPTTATTPMYPDFSDRANVIFGADNRVLFGDGDVFSIDRGTAHGVAAGSRFAIYRDHQAPGQNRIPPPAMRGQSYTDPRPIVPLVYIGDAVVMSVTETTSKLVVTKAVDGIVPGDVVVPRRPASQQ